MAPKRTSATESSPSRIEADPSALLAEAETLRAKVADLEKKREADARTDIEKERTRVLLLDGKEKRL